MEKEAYLNQNREVFGGDAAKFTDGHETAEADVGISIVFVTPDRLC